MSPDDHAEILRLRDRLHRLESENAAWRLRAESFLEWRQEIGRKIEGLEKSLGALLESDHIAEAVAERMNAQNTLRLTWAQRAGAFVIFVLSVASSLKVLVG